MSDIQGDLIRGYPEPEPEAAPSAATLREDEPITHVVSVSGGVTSWMAARLAKDHYMRAGDELVLLFADTLMEDASTYRFLEATGEDLGVEITRISDGRTPWELFKDKKFLGNNRAAICSRVLKRELLERWRNENCEPEHSAHYIGLDWLEINRFESHCKASFPWHVRAPLIDRMVEKQDCIAEAEQRGMPLPSAYAEGFAHANCAGMCVRAGKGHWGQLYRFYPKRFAYAMRREEELREFLQKDVTILKEQRHGKTVRLSLHELKARLDAKPGLLPVDDGGGCGCALATMEGDNHGSD